MHTAQEWSWFRGALCTVDRSFGWLLDHTFHHISDTHVCHHIFSKMPFYHAQVGGSVRKKSLPLLPPPSIHHLHHLTPLPPLLPSPVLQEASEHIKKALGPYYLKDDTPIWKALWRSYTLCKYVDTDKDLVFYKQRASS